METTENVQVINTYKVPEYTRKAIKAYNERQKTIDPEAYKARQHQYYLNKKNKDLDRYKLYYQRSNEKRMSAKQVSSIESTAENEVKQECELASPRPALNNV